MTLLLAAAFVLSGAAGLMYESIWSRYLGLFVGHSAGAQVIVLVIYLGGMSLVRPSRRATASGCASRCLDTPRSKCSWGSLASGSTRRLWE